MAITHGCIRMYPEDVAALFKAVPVGTKVWLINDPVKVAYVDGDLLVEAHPPPTSIRHLRRPRQPRDRGEFKGGRALRGYNGSR